MYKSSVLLVLLIVFAALPACTAARPGLAMVEPTYSYLRDSHAASRHAARAESKQVTLTSDARPGPLTHSDKLSDLSSISINDVPQWQNWDASTKQ